MGFGIKIGGLSLNKIVNVAQIAELAIKTQVPLSSLAVGAKLAENVLSGNLLKDSLQRKFAEIALKPLAPLDPKNFNIIE